MAGNYGDLVPVGGGDPIELFKNDLLVGRRESCDIVLRFSNVSAHHCQLFLQDGYWYIRDLGSTNGFKINGVRPKDKDREHLLHPSDRLTIAKLEYQIHYSPADLGALGPPPAERDMSKEIFQKSLLERAGLAKKPIPLPQDDERGRFDVLNNAAGQIKKHDRPV
ncbi:MAG TPA: FHA domain-containing protein [Pirellulales bacterium]|jgi:adenylate cyclase